MSNEKSIIEQYNSLPLIARILIQIFLGFIATPLYRVFKFIETKNTVTLVVAIITFVTGAGFGIFWIIDLITLIFKGGYTVLAD